jgi:GTP-binding protein Era
MTHCGYVAIIGRPNVGKSTLMNALIGQKVSITSRKPQTTRNQILGILTENDTQYIFVDTPGMHQTHQANMMNRYLNRAAFSSLQDVNVILWLIEPKWTAEEDWIYERLSTVEVPIVLAINKSDSVKDKKELLPLMEQLEAKKRFATIMPLSALNSYNVPELLRVLKAYFPEQPYVYGEDEVTNKSVKFLVSEIIREKLMRYLGDELPYQTAVEIETFKETPKLVDINAVIYVERDTQKAIVIGDKGSKLKEMGTEARRDIETLVGGKVMLRLWVKVRENWRSNEALLNDMYT